jgi:hypothetical protein
MKMATAILASAILLDGVMLGLVLTLGTGARASKVYGWF